VVATEARVRRVEKVYMLDDCLGEKVLCMSVVER
jgi:hypothetical protein